MDEVDYLNTLAVSASYFISYHKLIYIYIRYVNPYVGFDGRLYIYIFFFSSYILLCNIGQLIASAILSHSIGY